MTDRVIVIGTRGSLLALWQANFTKDTLEKNGFKAELKIIKTQGDRIDHLSFDKLEGKGFFTKELEEELLNGTIDLAVHSHKDLPTQSPPGLTIGAVSSRANPEDVLLIRPDRYDKSLFPGLKPNAKVGTSSPRRKAQLLYLRNDLEIADLRGNVPTRVQKLRDGLYDAIVLAAAGLDRLNLDISDLEAMRFPAWQFIPAPAQGVLAFQTRSEDILMEKIISCLHDLETAFTTEIERKILAGLEGGCQSPASVFAKKKDNHFELWAGYAATSDDVFVKLFARLPESKPELISSLVRQLKNPVPAQVFISRELEENSPFLQTLTRFGYQVTGKSLIDFEPVPFEIPGKTDWVFFVSPNCVRFFFSRLNGRNIPEANIAVLGTGTLKVLKEYGFDAHFIGSESEPTDVARSFLKVAGNSIVLFPGAENSLQSVQEICRKGAEVIHLPVYRSFPASKVTQTTAKFLVFTSPLNAEAYLSSHPILPGQKLVAIGNATANAIEKAGYCCIVAYRPTEEALAETVIGAGIEA